MLVVRRLALTMAAMLNVIAGLLGLIFVVLAFIARDLRILAKARAYDLRHKDQRESVIGFGPTSIPAGESITLTAKPSARFDGERLIVPSSIANNFNIEDISVNGESQAVSANPIPASAFSELAVGVNLGLKSADEKTELQIKVTNATKEAKTFGAALIGYISKDTDLGTSARATSEPAVTLPTA